MERPETCRSVIWSTGITENYVERARPFLRSVEQHGQVFDARQVVTVGFVASDALRAEFPSIEFVMLPYGFSSTGVQPLILCQNEKGIIQHGEFLRAVHSDQEAVILFTDSDMVMQRGPNEIEMLHLRGLGEYEVGVGPCAGPGRDALMQEAARLYPHRPLSEIESWLQSYLSQKDLSGFEVYCTGVVAATRAAWFTCLERFVPKYQTMQRFFAHYARIQWLMSVIFDTPPFKVWRLPYTFTAHGCYGCPPPVKVRPDGVAVVEDTPVMFRHAM